MKIFLLFPYLMASVMATSLYNNPGLNQAGIYNYAYGVNDNNYGTHFGASESADGLSTVGEYHVLLPDGRLQTVNYHVGDAYSGYVADVSYSGSATFPGVSHRNTIVNNRANTFSGVDSYGSPSTLSQSLPTRFSGGIGSSHGAGLGLRRTGSAGRSYGAGIGSRFGNSFGSRGLGGTTRQGVIGSRFGGNQASSGYGSGGFGGY